LEVELEFLNHNDRSEENHHEADKNGYMPSAGLFRGTHPGEIMRTAAPRMNNRKSKRMNLSRLSITAPLQTLFLFLRLPHFSDLFEIVGNPCQPKCFQGLSFWKTRLPVPSMKIVILVEHVVIPALIDLPSR
jgi:hypothetical protein